MMDADKIRQFLDSKRMEFISKMNTFEVMNRLSLKDHIREKIDCRREQRGIQEANCYLIDEVKRNNKLLIKFIDVVRECHEDLATLIDAELTKSHQSQMKSSTPPVEKLKMQEMHAEPVEQTTGHGIEEVGACAATNDLSRNGDTLIPQFGVNENTRLPNQKVFPQKQLLVVSPKRSQSAAPITEQSPENNTEYHSVGGPVAEENCDGDMADNDSSLCFNSEEVDKAYQFDGDLTDVASGINIIKSLKNQFDQMEDGTADSMEENREMNVENVSERICESPGVHDFEGKKVYNKCTFNVSNHYEKSNIQLHTEGSKIALEKAKRSHSNSGKSTRPHDCESPDALDMDRALEEHPVPLCEMNESEESSIPHDDCQSQTDLKKVAETCPSDIVNSEPKSVLSKPDEYASQKSSVTSDESETYVKEVVEPSDIIDSESSLSTPNEVMSENGGILNKLKQGIWIWFNGIG